MGLKGGRNVQAAQDLVAIFNLCKQKGGGVALMEASIQTTCCGVSKIRQAAEGLGQVRLCARKGG